AMPLYLKDHSYGEYVFDWAWADAYHQHGLEYYPKLLSAIPFTPVSGARLLARDNASRHALVCELMKLQQDLDLSSIHILYPPQDQIDVLQQAGFMVRHGVQFHWINRDYHSFDEFLMSLDAK